MMSHADGQTIANFFTGQLRGLVAQQRRSSLPPEPSTIEEALSGPHAKEWQKAIQLEYDTLLERNTWELKELPWGRRAIGVKWLLKVKTTATGLVDKFKARLVAKGYSQVKGVDFNNTYAPVSRFTTLRVLMAKTAIENLHVTQLDVKNAFLYGTLDETELYMKQPPGYDDGTGRVCKLVKSLYGLKQAPLVWYYNIEQYLLDNGWTVCETDWALFKYSSDIGECLLLLYVDDILILSDNPELVDMAKKTLVNKYKMHEENLTKYLGINIKIERDSGRVTLNLQQYAEKLKDKFEVGTTPTPLRVPISIDPNTEAAQDESWISSKEQVKDYQSRIGSLMFAASTTRPDLQLACSKLGQGNKKPSSLHMDQANRCLKYFCDTSRASLTFVKAMDPYCKLVGFSDANYNRNGTSQSGYIFLLGGSAVSWASKKQSCPVLSSTEAELVAAVSAAQEAVYLRRLLQEIGHPQTEPTTLFIDNSAVIDLTKTEKRLGNSKHFNRLSWLRHVVREKIVQVVYVNTKDQVADYLTKVLSKTPFGTCREGSGLHLIE
jgi:hypothetical protein